MAGVHQGRMTQADLAARRHGLIRRSNMGRRLRRSRDQLRVFVSCRTREGRALVFRANKPGKRRLLGLAPGRHAESFLVEVR